MSLHESRRLAELEKVIARGKQTFVEVGLALAEIRDLRLYKREYGSFSEYCREKWGWETVYAYYMIAGAEVVKELPEKVSTLVATETAARELAKIRAEQRAGVVQAIVDEGKPVTAKEIKKHLPPPPMRAEWRGRGQSGTAISSPYPAATAAGASPGRHGLADSDAFDPAVEPRRRSAGDADRPEPDQGSLALGPGQQGHAVRGGLFLVRAVPTGSGLDGHQDRQAVRRLPGLPGPGVGQVHAVPGPGTDLRAPLEYVRVARGQGVQGKSKKRKAETR